MKKSLKDILVVSDMDGTLLNENKELLKGNIESIKLFTSLGGKFTVATGRLVESVLKYPELTGLITPGITSGGSVIYDFYNNGIIHNEVLPKMISHNVMNDMMRRFPYISILVAGSDTKFYQVAPSKAAQKLFDEEKMSFYVRAQDDLPPDWNKMLFAGQPDQMAEVEEFLNSLGYPGVSFIATERHYVEMMPEGVSKGSALKKLCDIMNVDIQNTIVIGDYYNDVEMMKEAGKAVAMSNAPSEVKMIADAITDGNCNQCGVGQYLYKIVQDYS